jgi:hypothetical protein
MGAILGLGVTHYPPLCGRDEDMARILKRVLQDPGLPEKYRQPSGWPAAMAEEYGADQGLGAAEPLSLAQGPRATVYLQYGVPLRAGESSGQWFNAARPLRAGA